MTESLEQIEQSIRTRDLFRLGEKILVAVSGGVDSMVLLHILQKLARKNQWRLTVAHLNHQLRGRAAEADEKLVVRTARKLHLPVIVERADVKRLAASEKLSLEMAGRKLRHDFLARTAVRLKIRKIALAHHADDQIELFFLRLFRGSGSEGLSGMKWNSPSPADPRIQLIRPLLGQSKRTLRDYAAVERIPFREDASNDSLEFQRNQIRNELLPLLRKKYQPALDNIILRLMDVLGAESAFLNQAAIAGGTEEGGKNRQFDKLPVAIQRRRIQAQLLQHGIAADFDLIERLRNSTDFVFCVGPELAVKRGWNGEIRLSTVKATTPDTATSQLDLGAASGKLSFADTEIRWRVDSKQRTVVPKPGVGREVFDADRVGQRVILRHWQPGDRFQPIGMKQSVKLQDFFTNQKIPRERRHELIVATTEGGEIFWVEGLRISELFKVTPQTRRRLHWYFQRKDAREQRRD